MSLVDCITAILAIPGVEEGGDVRDARPGEAILDEHFVRLGERFSQLGARADGQPSELDRILGQLLGRAVIADGVDFTYYEKKGLVYPAIAIHSQGITTPSGEPVARLITTRFREDTARTELAELLGKAMDVEWVSIYTTFGPALPEQQ